VPARLVALPVVLVLLAAAGCSGGGEDGSVATAPSLAALLDRPSFAAVVTAAIQRGDDYRAEASGKTDVVVTRGLDRARVSLKDAFADYRAHPDRRDAIVHDVVARARAAVDEGVPRTSYDAVRRDVMPLLEPTFVLRKLGSDPPRTPFARGLAIVYGIDRDGDFTLVQDDDLHRWGVALADLATVAQANLVRNTDPLLCEEQLCGWAGGDGYDATRMTSKVLRAQIEKKIGRAAYAVPLQDVFVAVPIRYAARIQPKVVQEFTTGDQPISRDVFVERDGRLVPLDG
jgi:uncharacterized protein YtpQ (UPF0354 family)